MLETVLEERQAYNKVMKWGRHHTGRHTRVFYKVSAVQETGVLPPRKDSPA